MSDAQKCRFPSRERGISLVESMLVLGIAASFIAGGTALYGIVTERQQANRVAESVLVLRAKGDEYCHANGHCYGITIALRSTAQAEMERVLGPYYDPGCPSPLAGDRIAFYSTISSVSFGIIVSCITQEACVPLSRAFAAHSIPHYFQERHRHALTLTQSFVPGQINPFTSYCTDSADPSRAVTALFFDHGY